MTRLLSPPAAVEVTLSDDGTPGFIKGAFSGSLDPIARWKVETEWWNQRVICEYWKVLLNNNAEIDAKGKQTNRGISHESTALHAAVEGGKTHAAKLLLERGANPNIIDTWKKTPLHFAAQKGNVEIVKALLAHKADLTIKDDFGRSLLDSASKEVREAVADWEKGKK